LKHVLGQFTELEHVSLPVRERGLEHGHGVGINEVGRSLPQGERGLKRDNCASDRTDLRSLFVRAVDWNKNMIDIRRVAGRRSPCGSVDWNEPLTWSKRRSKAAPSEGAWI